MNSSSHPPHAAISSHSHQDVAASDAASVAVREGEEATPPINRTSAGSASAVDGGGHGRRRRRDEFEDARHHANDAHQSLHDDDPHHRHDESSQQRQQEEEEEHRRTRRRLNHTQDDHHQTHSHGHTHAHTHEEDEDQHMHAIDSALHLRSPEIHPRVDSDHHLHHHHHHHTLVDDVMLPPDAHTQAHSHHLHHDHHHPHAHVDEEDQDHHHHHHYAPESHIASSLLSLSPSLTPATRRLLPSEAKQLDADGFSLEHQAHHHQEQSHHLDHEEVHHSEQSQEPQASHHALHALPSEPSKPIVQSNGAGEHAPIGDISSSSLESLPQSSAALNLPLLPDAITAAAAAQFAMMNPLFPLLGGMPMMPMSMPLPSSLPLPLQMQFAGLPPELVALLPFIAAQAQLGLPPGMMPMPFPPPEILALLAQSIMPPLPLSTPLPSVSPPIIPSSPSLSSASISVPPSGPQSQPEPESNLASMPAAVIPSKMPPLPTDPEPEVDDAVGADAHLPTTLVVQENPPLTTSAATLVMPAEARPPSPSPPAIELPAPESVPIPAEPSTATAADIDFSKTTQPSASPTPAPVALEALSSVEMEVDATEKQPTAAETAEPNGKFESPTTHAEESIQASEPSPKLASVAFPDPIDGSSSGVPAPILLARPVLSDGLVLNLPGSTVALPVPLPPISELEQSEENEPILAALNKLLPGPRKRGRPPGTISGQAKQFKARSKLEKKGVEDAIASIVFTAQLQSIQQQLGSLPLLPFPMLPTLSLEPPLPVLTPAEVAAAAMSELGSSASEIQVNEESKSTEAAESQRTAMGAPSPAESNAPTSSAETSSDAMVDVEAALVSSIDAKGSVLMLDPSTKVSQTDSNAMVPVKETPAVKHAAVSNIKQLDATAMDTSEQNAPTIIESVTLSGTTSLRIALPREQAEQKADYTQPASKEGESVLVSGSKELTDVSLERVTHGEEAQSVRLPGPESPNVLALKSEALDSQQQSAESASLLVSSSLLDDGKLNVSGDGLEDGELVPPSEDVLDLAAASIEAESTVPEADPPTEDVVQGAVVLIKVKDRPHKRRYALNQCTVCERVLLDPSSLRKHMKIHAPKAHPCTHPGCTKAFIDASKLKRHQLVHTGDRPFLCVFPGCGKLFSLEHNLRAHARTHTGERPYACEIPGCARRFCQVSNLKSHMKTHSKEAQVAGKAAKMKAVKMDEGERATMDQENRENHEAEDKRENNEEPVTDEPQSAAAQASVQPGQILAPPRVVQASIPTPAVVAAALPVPSVTRSVPALPVHTFPLPTHMPIDIITELQQSHMQHLLEQQARVQAERALQQQLVLQARHQLEAQQAAAEHMEETRRLLALPSGLKQYSNMPMSLPSPMLGPQVSHAMDFVHPTISSPAFGPSEPTHHEHEAGHHEQHPHEHHIHDLHAHPHHERHSHPRESHDHVVHRHMHQQEVVEEVHREDEQDHPVDDVEDTLDARVHGVLSHSPMLTASPIFHHEHSHPHEHVHPQHGHPSGLMSLAPLPAAALDVDRDHHAHEVHHSHMPSQFGMPQVPQAPNEYSILASIGGHGGFDHHHGHDADGRHNQMHEGHETGSSHDMDDAHVHHHHHHHHPHGEDHHPMHHHSHHDEHAQHGHTHQHHHEDIVMHHDGHDTTATLHMQSHMMHHQHHGQHPHPHHDDEQGGDPRTHQMLQPPPLDSNDSNQ